MLSYRASSMRHALSSAVIMMIVLTSCNSENPNQSPPDHVYWDMESALKNPLDVWTLYLGASPSSGLIPEIIAMKNLEDLMAPHCNIDSLPAGLCELHKLKHLHLDYNHIKSIQSEIFCCTGLQTLAYPNNPISRIPDSMNALLNLAVLVLDSCRINNVPSSFTQTALVAVSIRSNMITSMPDSLFRMKKTLKYLDLRGNPIPQKEKDRILKELTPGVEVLL